jgi:hypothetical protein
MAWRGLRRVQSMLLLVEILFDVVPVSCNLVVFSPALLNSGLSLNLPIDKKKRAALFLGMSSWSDSS